MSQVTSPHECQKCTHFYVQRWLLKIHSSITALSRLKLQQLKEAGFPFIINNSISGITKTRKLQLDKYISFIHETNTY